MSDLKPCPCGKVPTHLTVMGNDDEESGVRYFDAWGNCCNQWRVSGLCMNITKNMSLEDHAEWQWNAAPRGEQHE